jgi:hypothetical protein
MVGNTLRLMLTRGLSIIRWNNFPRVIDAKQMDNVGATLHTALFLAYEQRQITGEEIDTLYLMKKIIFTSLADLILSDINSGTKGYIKKLDEDISTTLNDKTKIREDQIFVAAKKYVGFVEASTNARVFPEIYEVPLDEIKKELSHFS